MAERRARFSSLAPALLVLLLPELGCFVSFDGYAPLENTPDASAGGAKATGGQVSSSGGAAGQGTGGAGSGGISSNGGTAGSSAGGTTTGGVPTTGGTPNTGGVSAGGTIGSGGSPETGGAQSSGGVATGGATNTGGAVTGGQSGTGGSDIICPQSLAGPVLIEAPKPGGGTFCIDRTEVTNEDYAAFLASSPGTSGQVAACSWNTSYAPATSTGCQYDAANSPKIPISCVDWCDARSYCAWAGKRLCGAFDGGPAAPGRYADAAHSQWYAACSLGGTRAFPYGDVYIGDACVGLNHDGTAAENVATHPGCRGGYAGIYDMSGNVAEWEDSCSGSTGASDACLHRGGHRFSTDTVYDTPPVPTLSCNSSDVDDSTPSPATARRDLRTRFIGFRCCYDP